MKITIMGAAGFIGTNLAIALAKNKENYITMVDKRKEFFSNIIDMNIENIKFIENDLESTNTLDALLKGQDVVYHLVSTTVPTTANQHIVQELESNVVYSASLFEACVRSKVSKVIFISSGGTVYGNKLQCPLKEEYPTNPISSYGVQKITIEKLLQLYNYMYNMDYRIIRLANPYGPYQRPNGILGAATTFIYKTLTKEEIFVYGNGEVIRDYIFIDDVITAIINIAQGEREYKMFNVGCGVGISINHLLDTIQRVLKTKAKISYLEGRMVDVPVNFLDVSRYERCYGKLCSVSLEDGILKTAEFMKKEYNI